MNRESSIFLTMTETIVFCLCGFNRPPSSPESTSLPDVSSAGSGTNDRFKVSGTRSTTRVPRNINPTLTLMGTNMLFFNSSQERGMATTVAIKVAAVPWKKTAALKIRSALKSKRRKKMILPPFL